MKEILQLPNKELKQHIHTLAKDYKERTGTNVCLSCPSDIQNMLNYLKKIYMTTQFQLKKPFVIYKIQKGSGATISNDKMTDELAIQFLKVRPERIELFSKYPEDWKDMIGLTAKPSKSTKAAKTTKKKPCSNCKKKTITKKDNADDK